MQRLEQYNLRKQLVDELVEEFLRVSIDTEARKAIASFYTCHACSEDLGVEDLWGRLACANDVNHIFHLECLRKWKASQR